MTARTTRGGRERLRGRSLTTVFIGLLAAGAVLTISFGAGAGTNGPGAQGRARRTTRLLARRPRSKPECEAAGAEARSAPARQCARVHTRAHEPEASPRERAARAHRGRAPDSARRLAARPERRVPALRARGVGGHGAGPRRKHPEIKTYSGRGIDDPTATIHADLSPLGFHASVRSPNGAWYIDPYYHLDQSVYASYYGRDAAGRAARRLRRARRRTRPSSRSTAATTTPPTR